VMRKLRLEDRAVAVEEPVPPHHDDHLEGESLDDELWPAPSGRGGPPV